MDNFTKLFWLSFLVFAGLSLYLVSYSKTSSLFYVQIASGFGMFLSSKIGRKFLGLA